MQSRRAIAERVIARARGRGKPIDDGVEFMALVEQWVEGDNEIEEMRRRYIDLLARRSAERKAPREDPVFAETSQIAAASTTIDAGNDERLIVDDAAPIVVGDAAEGPPPEEARPRA